MSDRKFFVGGNWKMNGNKASISKISDFLQQVSQDSQTEVVVGCPAIYLEYVRTKLPAHFGVSAQNCYYKSSGAFTGEISPEMIKDVNCEWVILGHSERRSIFKETDKEIGDKCKLALEQGLKVIACIGETLEERDSGKTMDVVFRQMAALKDGIGNMWDNVVVAYEPVWAIGTGRTADPSTAQEVHGFLRGWLKENINEQVAAKTRIIYGGSVTSANCRALSQEADIDGFLVGGASLKPEFVEIINAKA